MHPRPHPRTSASPRLCGRLFRMKPKASFDAVSSLTRNAAKTSGLKCTWEGRTEGRRREVVPVLFECLTVPHLRTQAGCQKKEEGLASMDQEDGPKAPMTRAFQTGRKHGISERCWKENLPPRRRDAEALEKPPPQRLIRVPAKGWPIEIHQPTHATAPSLRCLP